MFLTLLFAVIMPQVASASTIATTTITSDTEWTLAGSPYLITSQIYVTPNTTLTIDPGVVVKIAPAPLGNSLFHINGRLIVGNPSSSAEVVFTSIADDTYGGDSNNDGASTTPEENLWTAIGIEGDATATSTISHARFRYGGWSPFIATNPYESSALITVNSPLIVSDSTFESVPRYDFYLGPTSLDLEHCVFEGQNSIVRVWAYYIVDLPAALTIHDSSMRNVRVTPINLIQGLLTAHLENNWWGAAAGPYDVVSNPTGTVSVPSPIPPTFIPFNACDLIANPSCADTGPKVSNVLFLPGILGSRLYEQEGMMDCSVVSPGTTPPLPCYSDSELWVSSGDSKQSRLALGADGKSVNPLYTKDDTQNIGEIDETGVVDDAYTSNIYQSFIDDLRGWKSDGTIKDYAFIPYDWRLSLDDIITNGSVSSRGNLSYTTQQNFSESYLLKELAALQASSPTKKVTIVAHSMGGLVAKALIQKLKDTGNPLYEMIDKVILVAVPQVGTPDAVAGLLHGSGVGPLGIIMSSARSRQLSKNMPSVYDLLPSAGYFTTVKTNLDSLATFPNTPAFSADIAQYGASITNEIELKNYMLGSEGRSDAPFNFTINPAIGNPVLYENAQVAHQALDAWQPASSTKVIQVAGWGEETLAGIDYVQLASIGSLAITTLRPRKVIDGDGTVVTPSALWMSNSAPNVERWWVNLQNYNNPIYGVNRKHADILEIPNLLSFIKSGITNTAFIDPQNIIVNNTSTFVSSEEKLHFTLHSPLTLGFTDVQGNYVGATATTTVFNIPGVSYERYGEVQWLSVPKSLAGTVVMRGTGSGSFALDVEEQQGNTIVATTTFAAIPSSTSTIATLSINPSTDPTASSTLVVDYNGDGTIDSSYEAKKGEVVLPNFDTVPPEAIIGFNASTEQIELNGIDETSTTTINVTATSATVTDLAGNWLTLNMGRDVSKSHRVALTIPSFSYSTGTTTKVSTSLRYFWSTDKKGKYTMFISAIRTPTERLIALYIPRLNKTYIVSSTAKDDGDDLSARAALLLLRKKIKTYNGLYVPGVRTDEGGVIINSK